MDIIDKILQERDNAKAIDLQTLKMQKKIEKIISIINEQEWKLKSGGYVLFTLDINGRWYLNTKLDQFAVFAENERYYFIKEYEYIPANTFFYLTDYELENKLAEELAPIIDWSEYDQGD